MNSETKICQNCKNQFTIEPEDFQFYERIKVPPPTWCPECRLWRKTLWRNETTLYKRPDSRTGKTIFSQYSSDISLKVWADDDWYSDIWDEMKYGRDYDWNKSFFEQFRFLMADIPWRSRNVQSVVNSDYCNNASYLKNCYLVFSSGQIEDSCYSYSLAKAKQIFDSAYIFDSELSYGSFFNTKCFNALFSSHRESSQDIIFCKDCVGVSNCFGCVGLRNKSYHIFNKPASKEEYKLFLEKANLGSYGALIGLTNEVYDFWDKYPMKYINGRHLTDSTGDYLYNSKNAKNSFHVRNGENLKYCQYLLWGTPKDSYDHFRFSLNSELIYDSIVCGDNIYNLKFCYECYPSCDSCSYCMRCYSSSNLFGCIGVRRKQYCILNKQYSKEEYEELVPKIIKHMDEKPYIDKLGRVYKYGEFFPPELSPFAYNETIAQEYFPLTKDQVLIQGYRWKDPEEKSYEIGVMSNELPDHIKDVKDDIVGQVIQCAHQGQCNEQCATAFKIIPEELQFYQRMNLPLPRLCPNCRHYQRLKQRNPLKLWHRQCQCAGQKSENNIYQNTAIHQHHGEDHCPNEFETSYAPERKEIVYCEQCYNAEVV